ncbi:Ig-like domain-containing protein [Metabacillus fastidiosus]|uniref:Ig-like domain-containing protein n=1 Tax=Metabacillus fastidiosus TaxID=1458 RepID=UPI002E1C76E4|nr:Ig-like domain-containing protein [Metabacillus fastidiosus]
MTIKLFNNLPESTSRTQTHVLTIPGLKTVNKITVNTGSVTITKIEGDKVTIQVSVGTYTRRVQTGGSYTPSDSKTLSTAYGYAIGESYPSSRSYSSGGYSGTLTVESVNVVGNNNIVTYSGLVTKPASDTRTYTYYYEYDVTVDYVDNSTPTLTLNTANNHTLYENDMFVIDGQASDIDNGNIVSVKYQLSNGQIRVLAVGISDGTSKITFNKQLIFKAGKLFDGETPITDSLTEGIAHQLKVWSEDDQGGKAMEEIRTFFVVPNRPPSLTIDAFTNQTDLINNDTITISGTATDPDGNDVKVSYKLNNGLSTEILSGVAGPWSFDLKLKDLIYGENIIIVEVIDSYNFKFSKTIKPNKIENVTPLLQSDVRYKITPPSGSAKGVLLWIQREAALSVSAEISMTLNGEQEQFVPMTLEGTTALGDTGIVEDEFLSETVSPKENIIVKLNLSRESTNINPAITLISGVLE